MLTVGRNLPSLPYRFCGPCLVQETINAVQPEFAAHGYANLKADVSTMTTLRHNCFYIPSDSPPKENTVYSCEFSLNRQIREQNVGYYENNNK